MNIPVSQLPSGGYGYEFSDIQVSHDISADNEISRKFT